MDYLLRESKVWHFNKEMNYYQVPSKWEHNVIFSFRILLTRYGTSLPTNVIEPGSIYNFTMVTRQQNSKPEIPNQSTGCK